MLFERIIQNELLFQHVLQSLKRSTFPLEQWANAERTMNERWKQAEWMVCERRTEFGKRYVNGERWANSERERSAKRERLVNDERKVNARWTIYSESLVCFLQLIILIIPR